MFERFIILVKTFSPALQVTTLIIIFAISFLVRIFSVIKYESIIHEFDPWFNFRATKYLEQKGREEFAYWFDSDSWYPLGRFVGHTVFPGLMYTTVIMKKILSILKIPLDIRHVCVFTAPLFSILTSFVTYKLTLEINGRVETGLIAALFISVIPAYLSRSVAGAYDNEAISITLLVLTFYLFLRACKTGSYLVSCLCALSYSYLVASWGGYSFVITFIPVFVIAVLITKKFDYKIYIAYSIFYVISCFFSMNTKFVEFKVWHKSEHLGSHFVILIINVKLLYDYLESKLKSEQFKKLIKNLVVIVGFALMVFVIYLGIMGKTRFSERVLTLLDHNYAKNYIPIIASVSEHQAPGWAVFFFDLHFTLLFTPLGLYYILRKTTTSKLFIALYFVTTVYFAAIMVRLILILGPVMCILSAVGVSEFLHSVLENLFDQRIEEEIQESQVKNTKEDSVSEQENASLIKKNKKKYLIQEFQFEVLRVTFIIVILFLISYLIMRFMLHGSIVGAEIYSSPTVILSNRNKETGRKSIIDDFRNAYYWLRQNSVERSKVLAWWDYGYQIAGFSNRTTIVDNNTWNFTHIAQVGRVFASNEEDAYELLEHLDVDYVMILFGGRTGFSGDDMNKFSWILRITGNTFPHIKEQDYNNDGMWINQNAPPAMLNSVMYKLSYYRFWEEYTRKGKGYDLVRKQKVGNIGFKLKYFEEVFTSLRWLVRIYKVKKKSDSGKIAFTPKNILNTPKKLNKKELSDEEYFFIN